MELTENSLISSKKDGFLHFARIVKQTEKACQIHIAVDPFGKGVLVYSTEAWVPKSQIKPDTDLLDCFTINPWFFSKIKTYRLKRRYFLEKGKQIFV